MINSPLFAATELSGIFSNHAGSKRPKTRSITVKHGFTSTTVEIPEVVELDELLSILGHSVRPLDSDLSEVLLAMT